MANQVSRNFWISSELLNSRLWKLSLSHPPDNCIGPWGSHYGLRYFFTRYRYVFDKSSRIRFVLSCAYFLSCTYASSLLGDTARRGAYGSSRNTRILRACPLQGALGPGSERTTIILLLLLYNSYRLDGKIVRSNGLARKYNNNSVC